MGKATGDMGLASWRKAGVIGTFLGVAVILAGAVWTGTKGYARNEVKLHAKSEDAHPSLRKTLGRIQLDIREINKDVMDIHSVQKVQTKVLERIEKKVDGG